MLDGWIVLVPCLLVCLVLPFFNAREWLLNPIFSLLEDVFLVAWTGGALLGLILILLLGIYLYERFAPSPSADDAEETSTFPFLAIIGCLSISGWLIAHSFGLTSSEEWPALIKTSVAPPPSRNSFDALSLFTALAFCLAAGIIACMKGGYEKDKAKRKEVKAQRKAQKAGERGRGR